VLIKEGRGSTRVIFLRINLLIGRVNDPMIELKPLRANAFGHYERGGELCTINIFLQYAWD
jgi:hypothetical protein